MKDPAVWMNANVQACVAGGVAHHDADRSFRMLWAIPFALVGGFVLGEVLGLGPEARGWTVAPRLALLAVVVAGPFAVGAFHGLRAVRHGCHCGRGRTGLAVNLLLFVLFMGTVVGGTVADTLGG